MLLRQRRSLYPERMMWWKTLSLKTWTFCPKLTLTKSLFTLRIILHPFRMVNEACFVMLFHPLAYSCWCSCLFSSSAFSKLPNTCNIFPSHYCDTQNNHPMKESVCALFLCVCKIQLTMTLSPRELVTSLYSLCLDDRQDRSNSLLNDTTGTMQLSSRVGEKQSILTGDRLIRPRNINAPVTCNLLCVI